MHFRGMKMPWDAFLFLMQETIVTFPRFGRRFGPLNQAAKPWNQYIFRSVGTICGFVSENVWETNLQHLQPCTRNDIRFLVGECKNKSSRTFMNATVASQTMPSISGKMSYNVDFFETDFWSVPMQPFL